MSATTVRPEVRRFLSEADVILAVGTELSETDSFIERMTRVDRAIERIGDTPQSAEPPRWEPYVRNENAGATSRYDSQLNEPLGREVLTLDDNRRD